MTLLLPDKGNTLLAVSQTLKSCYPRVLALRDNYLANGIACLQEKPRFECSVLFDGKAKAKITVLACSSPSFGRAVWSLRLPAEKAVELDLVEAVSHNKV